MNGRLARLSRGDPETAKYYEVFGDPVQAALHWEREGARLLHVIDLDAAMGTGDNRALIQRILSEVRIPVQVGGGLRRASDAIEILGQGASRVLIGTLAFEKPEEFRLLIDEVGNERLVVALDYVEDKIVTLGWKQRTGLLLTEALRNLLEIGVTIFLLTAVRRDGLMAGPDLENLSKCVRIPGAKIIAAGGIGDLDDLERLRKIGIGEVVVGKALYEGRFTLREAQALFPE
jgi:phosphoribosylformimino-5-aminoimidazole carboxamide ribotide isomerase